jgi:hypothetical protein
VDGIESDALAWEEVLHRGEGEKRCCRPPVRCLTDTVLCYGCASTLPCLLVFGSLPGDSFVSCGYKWANRFKCITFKVLSFFLRRNLHCGYEWR